MNKEGNEEDECLVMQGTHKTCVNITLAWEGYKGLDSQET